MWPPLAVREYKKAIERRTWHIECRTIARTSDPGELVKAIWIRGGAAASVSLGGTGGGLQSGHAKQQARHSAPGPGKPLRCWVDDTAGMKGRAGEPSSRAAGLQSQFCSCIGEKESVSHFVPSRLNFMPKMEESGAFRLNAGQAPRDWTKEGCFTFKKGEGPVARNRWCRG